MTYEVQTPLVRESVEAARAAINGIQNGALEPKQASILISGARALQGAVSVDLKARMSAPKIAMQEAKLIENASSTKAISQAA